MNNQDKQNDWPEAEHSELDPILANLGQLTPKAGFADAVMARVAIPSHSVALQPSRTLSPRLGWALFGGYSVASAASMAIMIGMLSNGMFQIGTISASTMNFLLGMLSAISAIAETSAVAASQAIPVLLGGVGCTDNYFSGIGGGPIPDYELL